jgi:hypothetical protein
LIRNLLGYKWGGEQENVFNSLKEMLCSTPFLALPNFYKCFKIECDALGISI